MIHYLRLLFAPIYLRFYKTEDLLEALDLLMMGRNLNDKNLRQYCFDAELSIAKELIRRKVIFWEDLTDIDA